MPTRRRDGLFSEETYKFWLSLVGNYATCRLSECPRYLGFQRRKKELFVSERGEQNGSCDPESASESPPEWCVHKESRRNPLGGSRERNGLSRVGHSVLVLSLVLLVNRGLTRDSVSGGKGKTCDASSERHGVWFAGGWWLKKDAGAGGSRRAERG